MDTQKIRKCLFPGVISLVLILSSASCTQKNDFLNSSVVPAAIGTVSVKQDKNKNYAIEVAIVDLAEVERLSKQTYVVWIETENGKAENIGQLKSSTGFLSKQHKATLETVTSFKPVRLFVTAEDGIDVRYPDNRVVLTTDNL